MNRYEAEFSNLVKAYRKQHMGRGPSRITATFCKNWAICEMEGNLSPVEKFMVSAQDGKNMIRDARTLFVKDIYRKFPPVDMERMLGAKFLDLYLDIDVDKDYGMSIFVFDTDLQLKFGSS